MIEIAIFAAVAVLAVLIFIAYNAMVLDRENKWLWSDRERLQDERDYWKFGHGFEHYRTGESDGMADPNN